MRIRNLIFGALVCACMVLLTSSVAEAAPQKHITPPRPVAGVPDEPPESNQTAIPTDWQDVPNNGEADPHWTRESEANLCIVLQDMLRVRQEESPRVDPRV